MPVNFQNFSFSYVNAKKKPVFVPSEEGRVIGTTVKRLVEQKYAFDPFYWHLRDRGHVGALHEHRDHAWFARLDLRNFFYTVRRRRVQQALRSCGIKRHEFFAKWSTVRNPFDGGGYVLPYGFVQSPILSSLALSESRLGAYLRGLQSEITVGVYLDDISISSNDRVALESAYSDIKSLIEPSGFELNEAKDFPPAEVVQVFNCELREGFAQVLEERRAEFYAQDRSAAGVDAFERYCGSVVFGNA